MPGRSSAAVEVGRGELGDDDLAPAVRVLEGIDVDGQPVGVLGVPGAAACGRHTKAPVLLPSPVGSRSSSRGLGDPHLLDRESGPPQRAEHGHEVGADVLVGEQLSGVPLAVEAAVRDADPVQLIGPDRAGRLPGGSGDDLGRCLARRATRIPSPGSGATESGRLNRRTLSSRGVGRTSPNPVSVTGSGLVNNQSGGTVPGSGVEGVDGAGTLLGVAAVGVAAGSSRQARIRPARERR